MVSRKDICYSLTYIDSVIKYVESSWIFQADLIKKYALICMLLIY